MMELRTIGYREVGSLLVTVHSQVEPSNAEWDAYLDYIVRRHRRIGASASMLSLAMGGVATASQRAHMVRVLKPRPVMAAVLTSSPQVRRAVMDLRWFNPDMRCFAPGQLADALSYLHRHPSDTERVAKTLNELCREFGVPSPRVPEMRI